jgi:hypothetical protein
MKKTSASKPGNQGSKDILSEYRFDYSKAKPNRFAGRLSKERVVVLLDPEVSRVFTTAESVNTVLRALVAALPKPSKGKSRQK